MTVVTADGQWTLQNDHRLQTMDDCFFLKMMMKN